MVSHPSHPILTLHLYTARQPALSPSKVDAHSYDLVDAVL